MRYYIVRIDKPPRGKAVYVPIEGHDGDPIMFPDGPSASHAAAIMTNATGLKHQPRLAVADDNWEQREQERFIRGEYIPLPWAKEDWFDRPRLIKGHYAHVSNEDKSKIAYTANEENGKRDVQTRMSPSRYLTTFYKNVMTEEQIRKAVAHYTAIYDNKNQLKFATTAKEIVRVYRRGPKSCMSHSVSHFASGGIHPTSVYAGPDLAVAYLQQDERIVARTLVWPEKRIYGRLYGDGHRLKLALEAINYRHGSFVGARLTKVQCGSSYICPYLDGGYNNVKVTDKYLVISESLRGTYYAKNTHGLTHSYAQP